VSFAEAAMLQDRHDYEAAKRLLATLVHSGSEIAAGDTANEIASFSPGKLARLQFAIRGFLRQIVGSTQGGLVAERAVRVRMGVVPVAGEVRTTIDGSASDVVWYQLIALLRDIGVHRLQVCPGCGKTIVREGKREYCSTKCQERTYMRGYRRNQKNLPPTVRRKQQKRRS
jgi:predicted nucleic acid-binding Zn ribbon protein